MEVFLTCADDLNSAKHSILTIRTILLGKKDILYLRLFREKIELSNLSNGKEEILNHQIAYSNERLIIAYHDPAEKLIAPIIELVARKELIPSSKIFLFQPIHDNIDEYTNTELRGFRDTCEFLGASEVHMYFGKDKLSRDQILHGLKTKTFIQ